MNEQPTTTQTGLRYGLILGLVSVIFAAIQYLAGLERNTALTILWVAIMVVAIYFAHKYFKDQGDGFMTFGEGLKIGVIVAAVSGAISSVFNFFYLQFVDSSVLTKAMDEQRIKFEEQGMSDQQIEQAMGMAEKFTTPLATVLFIMLLSLFFGFVISLIISAITKNVNPEGSI